MNVVSSSMDVCCPLEERKHPESDKLLEVQDLACTGYFWRSKQNVLKTIDKVCGT